MGMYGETEAVLFILGGNSNYADASIHYCSKAEKRLA